MSPRRNWDYPNPSLASECVPPPRTGGRGGHTRLRVRGWGSLNSDDLRKSLVFCLLCGAQSHTQKTCIVYCRTQTSTFPSLASPPSPPPLSFLSCHTDSKPFRKIWEPQPAMSAKPSIDTCFNAIGAPIGSVSRLNSGPKRWPLGSTALFGTTCP